MLVKEKHPRARSGLVADHQSFHRNVNPSCPYLRECQRQVSGNHGNQSTLKHMPQKRPFVPSLFHTLLAAAQGPRPAGNLNSNLSCDLCPICSCWGSHNPGSPGHIIRSYDVGPLAYNALIRHYLWLMFCRENRNCWSSWLWWSHWHWVRTNLSTSAQAQVTVSGIMSAGNVCAWVTWTRLTAHIANVKEKPTRA